MTITLEGVLIIVLLLLILLAELGVIGPVAR